MTPCRIENFCLMQIGTADSGVCITEEAAHKSLDTFAHTPILSSPALEEDYLQSNRSSYAIGYVLGDVRIENNQVLGTVMIDEQYSDANRFSNWMIKLDGISDEYLYSPPYFQFDACEVV